MCDNKISAVNERVQIINQYKEF